MKLKRTFHAVGQGAFYTERFYEGEKNVFNVVYDCGTSSSQNDLVGEIRKEFAKGTIINHLFISHFHYDHISGIEELRRHCLITDFVIPVISPQMLAEATLYNYFWVTSRGYRDSGAKFDEIIGIIRRIGGESETIQIIEPQILTTHYIIPQGGRWVFVPYNPSQNPVNDIIITLRKNHLENLAEAYETTDFDRINNEIMNAKLEDLKQAYWDAFGKNHHHYIMPVYSGYANPQPESDERICLYTGDYDASDSSKVNALKHPMGAKWDAVGTFQVPHHGSKHNSCQELYLDKDRVYVISSFGNSKNHHPHGETIGYICNYREAKLQLVGMQLDLPSYSRSFVI